MNRSSALLATLALSMLSYAVGCGEDVGACNDPREGRDTVLVGDKVLYAGQAIMNKTCTGGCHNSQAEGSDRQGAPAGLDFNVVPVAESAAKGKKKSGDKIVKLSTAQLDALRTRQKTIYENRDAIWQQVREGLMPPDGMFESFTSLSGIKRFTSSDTGCKMGKELGDLSKQKETLRSWLACGAPIVESSGAVVTEPATPGVVGYQYPMCEAAEGAEAAGLVEGAITLEKLFEAQFSSCIGCHQAGGFAPKPDLKTLDVAIATMVDFDDEICDGKPYVTKGDPDSSFLVDMLSKDDPGCGHTRMPQFLDAFTEEQIDQVREWISNGAPITDDDVGKTPDDEKPEDEPGDEPEEEEPAEEEPVIDAGVAKDAGRADAGRADAGRDAGVADAGRDAGRRI